MSGNDWCILRMSGGRTLGVAKALDEAAYDVWAPAETVAKRVGVQRKRVEIQSPLLPTFVFARFDRLADLVALSRAPSMTFQVWDDEQRRLVTKGCPYFSVFRYGGAYPAVSDRSLDTLRLAEKRGQPIKAVRMFQPGEEVKCPDAGFEGLRGIVQTTRGRHALVLFDGFAIPVTIPARGLLAVA